MPATGAVTFTHGVLSTVRVWLEVMVVLPATSVAIARNS